VTPTTLFQAASISKPVAAMAALKLVEEGRLELDADVNEKLQSWKVPVNDFVRKKPVTLRGLVSHSAGMTVHGFPGYASDASKPTLRQILDGEPPANTAAIRVDMEPGTEWRYSGGGYTVMQQMLIDVAAKTFPELLRETVLDPIGMNDSTYEQPLPEGLRGREAHGYRPDGKKVEGDWHTYPEMAAAGLWTTPSDLARFAIEIQKSLREESNRVLSKDMTEQMLTPGLNNHGLGPSLSGKDDDARFGHGGSNEGFRCRLVAFRSGGRGAAVMTNSDSGGNLAEEILIAIFKEYGWRGIEPVRKSIAKLTPDELARYAGEYKINDEIIVSIRVGEEGLITESPAIGRVEIFPESQTKFFDIASGMVIEFSFEGDEVKGMSASGIDGVKIK
jgi:CubicO group peptidase (beta-lactamase class C family)